MKFEIRFRWKNVIIPVYVPTILFGTQKDAIIIEPEDREAEKYLTDLHNQLVAAVRNKEYDEEGDFLTFSIEGDEGMKKLLKTIEEAVKGIGDVFSWREVS